MSCNLVFSEYMLDNFLRDDYYLFPWNDAAKVKYEGQ